MMGAAQDVKIAPEARRVLAVIDLYGSFFYLFCPHTVAPLLQPGTKQTTCNKALLMQRL